MAAFGIDKETVDVLRSFTLDALEALDAVLTAQGQCQTDPLMRRRLTAAQDAIVAAEKATDAVVNAWDVEADPATHADIERDRRVAEGA